MKSNELTLKTRSGGKGVKTVEIRGHTLLCLQGFRGEGYNFEFVDNMAAVLAALQTDPRTVVRVTESPDQFCAHCPNLDGGCTLKGPDFERQIVAQDRQVLDLLGLKPGQEMAWAELLSRIGARMRGEMLDGICGDCRWLPLGYCKEGIDKLHSI